MHVCHVLVALALSLATPALAADPVPAAPPPRPSSPAEVAARHREKLSPFQVLVGSWRGEGWIDLGPRAGGRKTFQVSESVQPHLEGTVLTLEGVGTSRAAPTAPEVTTHQALGILSWDEAAGHLRFSAYRLGNGVVDTEMKLLGEGVFQWGFEIPQGWIRYTLTVHDGVWAEKGELSRDGGKSFAPFLEMTVRRTK
ncbi:hypothetical protein JGU66_08095 [Myxococcaceae bacterium JPH2]|nr:hypothetical protein [Myxococcaceae bacterium JPH2]